MSDKLLVGFGRTCITPKESVPLSGYGNDHISRVPSAYGYLNDCYEADSTSLTPDAGERIAQLYVKMLEKRYPEKD